LFIVHKILKLLVSFSRKVKGNVAPDPETSSLLIERLWREYISHHRLRIVFAMGCMGISAGATAINAWVLQPVLDDIFLRSDTSMLVFLPLLILGLTVLKGATGYLQMVQMKFVGQRISTDMQLTLYHHLLTADISFFANQSSARLTTRFSNDIQIVRRSLTTFLSSFAREIVTLLGLLGVMFYQSPVMAIVAFTIFPVMVFPVIKLGKKMRQLATKTQEEMGHFVTSLNDTFHAIRIVKAYHNESLESTKARSAMERLFSLYIHAARLESTSAPIMECFTGVAIALVIWYGGYQVLHHQTTPGAFFSFIGAMIMAYRPMKSLSGLTASTQEGLAAVARFYRMLGIRPKVKEVAKPKPLVLKKGAVELKNISFHYEKGMPVLKGVSLTAPAGKKVALVGASGGGKTTIFNLILRFYDPESGIIRIDGQDISKVTFNSLRSVVGIVTQDSLLFDDTIRSNIAYGKPSATEEEIIRAAKAAAAHDFIAKLPQGYDSMIGQHGVRLSGGQRQRIAIARAMLKNAPILLLDEATSSLDTASEHHVQKALDRLMVGRTTLVIAHRLSTVKDADTIHVVENGTIVESGSHEALLKKKGEYARLYERQFARQEKRQSS
jgi:subfamily B ATP-binding cassette protein MsbA